MKNQLFLIFFALIFSFSLSAGAASSSTTLKNFELRIHFGKLMGRPEAFSSKMGTIVTGSPGIDPPTANVIDLGYRLNAVPLLLGLRYEIINAENSGAGLTGSNYIEVKTKFSGYRIGAFADYRFLQFPSGYVGVLGHVGPMHALTYTIDSSNLTTATKTHYEFKGASGMGYSIGLDGGVIIQKLFTLGLEVGYTSFVSESSSDSITGADLKDSAGHDVKIDLSGYYYRASVGFTF